MMISFRHLRAHKDRVSAKEYNRLVDYVGMLASSMVADGAMMGGMILKRRVTGSGAGTPFKVFEVQATATGDGIYNCHEEHLDNSEWETEDGDPHTIEKNTTDIYVLNLLENHCHATYADMLIAGDKMACWQWNDDGDITRWVGVPIGVCGYVRLAGAQEDAQADALISVKLMNQDGAEVGAAFDVTCNIAQGGAALNEAIPRIAEDDILTVTNIGGRWYCTTLFMPSIDCTCTSP